LLQVECGSIATLPDLHQPPAAQATRPSGAGSAMAPRLPTLLALALAWPRSAAGGTDAGRAGAVGAGGAASAGAPAGASAARGGTLPLGAAGWSHPEGQDAANASDVSARGGCPQAAGGEVTEFSTSVVPRPCTTYRGLDFSYKSYTNYGNLGFGTREAVAWWCADVCNIDSKCRTYTVHTLRLLNGFRGVCYLHEHWLDDGASRFVKGSIGHDIFSAVCRPETGPC